MSGSQNPLVSDEGATAPGRGGADLQGESHLVGELVGAGIFAVGDATTGSVQGAEGRSGSVGQGQSEDNEHFHVGATYEKYIPLGLIPLLLYPRLANQVTSPSFYHYLILGHLLKWHSLLVYQSTPFKRYGS